MCISGATWCIKNEEYCKNVCVVLGMDMDIEELVKECIVNVI